MRNYKDPILSILAELRTMVENSSDEVNKLRDLLNSQNESMLKLNDLCNDLKIENISLRSQLMSMTEDILTGVQASPKSGMN
jgi:hypothetical protein